MCKAGAERPRAGQENIDIVLFRGVLWTRPGVDITDKIIRLLDQ